MRGHLLKCAVLALLISPNTYGSECTMEIHDGTLARDLTRAFQCVDQRLKSLENKPREPEQPLKDGMPSRNAATFDAGPFTVSVRAATRQNDTLFLGLQLYNKTVEPIFVALGEGVLIDEEVGVPIRLGGRTGIAADRIGRQGDQDESNYTLVPSNTILNFTLQCEIAQIKSNSLSLTLQLYSLKNRQIQRISAPISVTLKGK